MCVKNKEIFKMETKLDCIFLINYFVSNNEYDCRLFKVLYLYTTFNDIGSLHNILVKWVACF